MKKQLSENERFLIQDLKNEGIKPVFNKKGICVLNKDTQLCVVKR